MRASAPCHWDKPTNKQKVAQQGPWSLCLGVFYLKSAEHWNQSRTQHLVSSGLCKFQVSILQSENKLRFVTIADWNSERQNSCPVHEGNRKPGWSDLIMRHEQQNLKRGLWSWGKIPERLCNRGLGVHNQSVCAEVFRLLGMLGYDMDGVKLVTRLVCFDHESRQRIHLNLASSLCSLNQGLLLIPGRAVTNIHRPQPTPFPHG